MPSSAPTASTCAMSSAICCSRWCFTRAWPRSAAGSISPPWPTAFATSWCAVIRTCSPAPRSRPRTWCASGRSRRRRSGPRPRRRPRPQARCWPAYRGRCRRSAARRSSAAAPRAWASTGPRHPQVRAKVLEELQRGGRGARRRQRRGAGMEEIGDLLFAVVNWSRHLQRGCGSGAARLRTAKFERRFAHMEAVARARGLELEKLSAARVGRVVA